MKQTNRTKAYAALLLAVMIAFFPPGLYFIFENFGIKYTSAIKASLIASTIPVAVLILSALATKEAFSLKKFACLVLSLGGISLLIFNNPVSGVDLGTLSIGDMLMLGAVFSAAVYMILTRKMISNYDALVITSFQMIYGALFFLPFFLLQITDIDWNAIEIRQWSAGFHQAISRSVPQAFQAVLVPWRCGVCTA
jgi:drug/metabolite transporter (DMT)-like permease